MFSISKTEERIIVKLCGIKLSVLNKKYSQLRSQDPFYEYKQNKVDITTLPPATGQTREIQLANLELLKELDYVCKQNNIKYWLDFGSLIGAVRHKGFIPWDDDIDVGMLREDHDKMIEVFNSTRRNPDIYAEKTYGFEIMGSLIKICHKKCDHLFVDVFPYDYYGEVLTEEERLNKTSIIKQHLVKMQSDNRINSVFLNRKHREFREEFLLKNSVENSDLVWGIEFGHAWRNWFHAYDTIFPLRDVEFEGYSFPAVNKPDLHLKRIYGDYMAYPKKIGLGHNKYKSLKESEKLVIKDLINGDGK